jgi:phosphatidylglycerophosphate synthase
MKAVQRFRMVTDYWLLKLPLPNINPNLVSALSVATSVLFLISLKYSLALGILMVFVTLMLDWVDGLIAKKHGRTSNQGYVIDIVCDRYSEAIMFIPFFWPWFYLFALNTLLTYYSFMRNKHIILPLRHVFLVVLVIQYL